MPFGMKNPGATYQRGVDQVFADLEWKCGFLYLDDLFVFSDEFEAHLNHLEEVLKRAKAANLQFKIDKCFLFRRKLRVLGFIVSEQGVEADPEKIERMVNFPEPTNKKKLKSYL